MKARKEKQVKIKGNKSFVWYAILMCFVLLASLGLSIYDVICTVVDWPEQYGDVIGVSSQIITAIVSLVVSIIGIAISLQNEDFFGVKITRLYAMRVKTHYSILGIIVISVFLCTINLIFYMLGLNFAAIGTVIVALLFLMQVLFSEVPIMAKNEDAILKVLKDNIISCYIKKKEPTKDLKDSIKYLLYRKTLKETYNSLKVKGDVKFNQYLLMELLEVQQHLAFELKESYDDYQQRIIAHSLLQNIFDLVFHHIELDDNIYEEVDKNKHLLTRVLFRINELPAMKDIWEEKIHGLTQCLEFASPETEEWDKLLSEILIILISHTIQDGDFCIINAVRHQLSTSEYCLDKESPILNVFAVISMYLYYLKCCDSDVPDEIKNRIEEFINEGGMIENRTKISSWKELFSKASENFYVNYDKLVELSTRTETAMEYYLFGVGAKFVILDKPFFSAWYLSHLFNAQRLSDIDYETLCDRYPDIKGHLKDFGGKCLDENGEFSPTKEMEQIVRFYSDDKENFVLFRIGEERNHNLFNFVNTLRIQDLSDETNEAKQVDNNAFANEIRDQIENAVKTEWGFDPTLTIENDSRYFSILFEKMPRAFNFEKTIAKYCVDSVFDDLRKAVKKTIVYNNEKFEDGIRKALSKKPKYTTENTKKTIPYFFIHDASLQREFLELNESMVGIESRIIGNMFLVAKDGFKFNCMIEKVEVAELSEEEIAKKVASYQRTDGQFVYEGAFLPKETITEFVRSKFVTLTVVIKHQVVSSKKLVYQLKPYSKKPED